MSAFIDQLGNGNWIFFTQGGLIKDPTSPTLKQWSGLPAYEGHELDFMSFLGRDRVDELFQGFPVRYDYWFSVHCYQTFNIAPGTPITSATLRLRQNPTVRPFDISMPIALHVTTRALAFTEIGFNFPNGPTADWTLSTGYETAFGPFAPPIFATLSGPTLDIDCTAQVQAVINHPDWSVPASRDGVYFYIQTGLAAQRWITSVAREGRDDSHWVGGPNAAGDTLNNAILITV